MAEHPITPPPELVQQWASEWIQLQNLNRDNFMATRAAQWGADQELEACCEWLDKHCGRWEIPVVLRVDRRPKPPSLKQEALRGLEQLAERLEENRVPADLAVLRRALEALPDE